EPGSIDKEVAAKPAGLAGLYILDVARLVFDYPGDVIDDVTDPEIAHAMLANKSGEAARVQVIGVVGDSGILGRGDQFGRETQLTDRLLKTDCVREGGGIRVLVRIFRPEGREIQAGETFRQHQRMIVEIGLVTGHPTRELGALLERGVAL